MHLQTLATIINQLSNTIKDHLQAFLDLMSYGGVKWYNLKAHEQGLYAPVLIFSDSEEDVSLMPTITHGE